MNKYIISDQTINELSDISNASNSGNDIFEMSGRSLLHLQACIAMLMANNQRIKYVKNNNTSILFMPYDTEDTEDKTVNGKVVELPFALNAKATIDFAINWYNQLDQNLLPNEPDHDGSNSKGWKISKSGYWGNFLIEFYWCEHHK